MAGKFIELKDAAKQLGITLEQLQRLREAGKIHGYKDGASWKFKSEEVERFASSLPAAGGADADDLSFEDSSSFSGEDFDSLLKVDPASDSADNLEDSSILISGEAEPEDDLESSSTVIGKEEADKARFSDLRLADDDEDSDIRAAGSSVKQAGPADDLKLADSEDLSDELGLGEPLGLGEDLDFESDDALLLSDEDLKLSAGSNQEVLDDSGGSDLAIGAGDSGIGLASPSDSGLSLEGESSSAALELPEDEDMISLDDDLGSASDDGAALQQDEEFLLSPSDEMLGDESSDSGSQVIALDDSGAFDSDADVAAVGSGEPMLLEEEAEGLEAQLEPIDEAALVAGATPSIAATHATEAAYSAWNLMALVFVVMLLAVTGMLMADVVRNMWAWNSETGVSSGLANTIIEALGMK
ncbi:MAG: helix-turn-helix domain-containing protein [Pirellulaceae bacterium]